VIKTTKEVVLWVLCLFLAYVFFKAGVQKFANTSGWARAFHVWGYPVWFRVLVGIAEISAALLLLYKRSAALGALLIVAVMLGGMATHIMIQHRPGQITNEIFPFLLAAIIFIGRRRLLPVPRRKQSLSSAAN
jgi:uncharacterized membrane protein YphA (DoxX/SURF4 family)